MTVERDSLKVIKLNLYKIVATEMAKMIDASTREIHERAV